MTPSRAAAAARPAEKWLSVVGIGEDGVAGLAQAARERLVRAEVVFGGRRHLALAADLIGGEARPWPSPFVDGIEAVLALRGRPVCVVASGDPLHFGVGATLAARVAEGEIEVLPAPSAFALAAARLLWPLQDTETVSLHARPIEALRPLLHPGRRVLALTSDGAAPAAIGRLLAGDGFGASRLTVLESLGGPAERVTSLRADAMGERAFGPLNVVAVEVAAEGEARVLPLAGLPDVLFETDGQLSKRAVRAATLAALAPLRGELLWDVGAGSGSVAIEWMLRHPSLGAVAVEARQDRAARIGRNARACGVPGLEVVEGRAPAALSGLPAPDAVFVGGGVSAPGVLDAGIAALRPGGRLVANAVTLEGQARLFAERARLGGELVSIGIAHAEPVGGLTGWRPAMPVVQWAWVKR